MLESFCDLSIELYTTWAEYISKWGDQITRQKQQIKEWKKSNEQLWKDLRDAWSEGQTKKNLQNAGNELLGIKAEIIIRGKWKSLKELRWQKELLANSQKETDEQKRLREKAEFQLYLNNKALPKRPNKLKELGRIIKVKLQHFVEKIKSQRRRWLQKSK